MARSNICRKSGIPMDKKTCPCFTCVTRRHNAKNRSGNQNRPRKGSNPHGDTRIGGGGNNTTKRSHRGNQGR